MMRTDTFEIRKMVRIHDPFDDLNKSIVYIPNTTILLPSVSKQEHILLMGFLRESLEIEMYWEAEIKGREGE